MSDHTGPQKPRKKPELTDADKALLEAEPNWDRMSAGAKRLLNTKPDRQGAAREVAPKKVSAS